MANLRDLMNLVSGAPIVTEAEILTEAQNYEDMFSKLAKFVMVAKPAKSAGFSAAEQAEDDAKWTPEIRKAKANVEITGRAKDEIQWARTHLKRNDRIVWYLRFIRLSIIMRLMQSFEPDPFHEMFDTEVKLFMQKNSATGEVSNWNHQIEQAARNIDYLKRQLEHYMSYTDKIAKIASFVFAWQLPFQIFDDLGHLEKQWRDERSGLIKIEADEDEDKPVIEFTDGFAWVLLDRPSCEEEGEAMGHCGNRGSPANGDRIFSLRRKIMMDNHPHWRPSLTFILDKNGMLGEMKGRGNDKPSEKYHRHIITLLESEYVKGIKGGGYMPENNFAMTDLKPEDAEALMEKKPALATPLYYWQKNGVDETLMAMIRERGFQKTVHKYYPSLVKFSEDGQTAYLAEFKDVAEFMEYYGSDSAKRVFAVTQGEFLDTGGSSDESGRSGVWNELSKEDRHAIGLYLLEKEEDGIRAWCEEEGYEFEDYDPSDSGDVLGVIEHLDDDWVAALDSGFYSGEQAGAEKELYDAVDDTLQEKWNLVCGTGTLEYEPEEVKDRPETSRKGLVYDTKCYLATDSKSFLNYASAEIPEDFDGLFEDGEEIEIEEPRYGWSGFDDHSAVERFKEEAPDYSEFLKKLKGSEELDKAA